MFSEDELKSYEQVFNQLGITSQEEQKQVLEFMYSIGTIIYNNSKSLVSNKNGRVKNLIK